MIAWRLPLCVLLVAAVESHLGALGPKNVSQKDAEFERTYADDVNSELVNIYTFNHTVTRNRVSAGPHGRPRGWAPGLDWMLPLPSPPISEPPSLCQDLISTSIPCSSSWAALGSSLPPAVIGTGLVRSVTWLSIWQLCEVGVRGKQASSLTCSDNSRWGQLRTEKLCHNVTGR